MSIHISLIEQFSERIIKQLFLISSQGETDESFQNDSKNIIENLRNILVKLKAEENENVKLEDELRDLNSELFKLKMQFEDLNKKHEKLKNQFDELEKKIKESKKLLKDFDDKLNEVTTDKEHFKLQIENVESKISAKESEKEVLDQKKKINEEKMAPILSNVSIRINKMKENYNNTIKSLETENSEKVEQLKYTWTKKLSDLNQKIEQFNIDNFFLKFLAENSEGKIPELDIVINLLKREEWNLDDLKSIIDLPPILAIRTIKQMAVKKIVNFDEENSIVSISKDVFNS